MSKGTAAKDSAVQSARDWAREERRALAAFLLAEVREERKPAVLEKLVVSVWNQNELPRWLGEADALRALRPSSWQARPAPAFDEGGDGMGPTIIVLSFEIEVARVVNERSERRGWDGIFVSASGTYFRYGDGNPAPWVKPEYEFEEVPAEEVECLLRAQERHALETAFARMCEARRREALKPKVRAG